MKIVRCMQPLDGHYLSEAVLQECSMKDNNLNSETNKTLTEIVSKNSIGKHINRNGWQRTVLEATKKQDEIFFAERTITKQK